MYKYLIIALLSLSTALHASDGNENSSENFVEFRIQMVKGAMTSLFLSCSIKVLKQFSIC